MQGDADLAVVLVDGDVVGLADQRLGQRDRKGAVAEVQPITPWFEVDDHVGVGQRVADGGFDRVGGAMPLDDGLAGRNRHDGVGEVVPPGLAQAQPAQVDGFA